RSGRVIRVDEAGPALRAGSGAQNRIDVLHADGTVATYANLRPGARVEVGQAVATGQPLGSSGDAGSGAPLRLGVWKREADLSATGVAIRFHDGSAHGFVPQMGVAYAPACRASGSGCAPGEAPPEPESRPAHRRETPSRAVRRDDGACAC